MSRRWGYAKHHKGTKVTTVNPFLDVAGLFFYPLLSRFVWMLLLFFIHQVFLIFFFHRFECPSISFNVIDEDGVILAKVCFHLFLFAFSFPISFLGQLAYTAGVIVKCASTHPDISYLFTSQLDFLLYISTHKEVFFFCSSHFFLFLNFKQAFVRRASLYSLLCVVSPFPSLISHLSIPEISQVFLFKIENYEQKILNK